MRSSDGSQRPGRAGAAAAPDRTVLALAGVLLLQACAFALVGASGDFPLSDDWAYAHVVRSLRDGNGFDFLPWTGATLVLQALWGAAACALAGDSYEVLRATTLAFSLAGVAAFFALLREAGAGLRTAAWSAAGLALSPLWLNLSFTFMTEVPFAALALAASWAYARGLGAAAGQGRRALLAGGVAASAAFLVRQQALPVAAAAALVALLATRAAPLRSRLGDAACAAALPAACAAAWVLWVLMGDSVPHAVHNKLREASAMLSPLAVGDVAMRAAATAGLLFTPWAAALRPGRDYAPAAAAALGAALAAGAAILWAREQAAMFYLPNVMDVFTLGALTTRDTLFLGHEVPPPVPAALRAALTVVALAGAAVLGACLLRAAALLRPGAASEPSRRQALFLAAAVLLSAAASLVQTRYYFDRYLLLVLPLAVAASAALAPRARPGAAFAAFWLALSAYAVSGTHDYMQWNRARHALLAGLEARGVEATSIDGGVEFNADRLASRLGTWPSDAEARRHQQASAKSWWWVVDDEWVVAFRPLDGYAVADSRTWTRWLPPREDRVLLLRRNRAGDDRAGNRADDAATVPATVPTGPSTGTSEGEARAAR